jgi:uncharacterized protein YkwD
MRHRNTIIKLIVILFLGCLIYAGFQYGVIQSLVEGVNAGFGNYANYVSEFNLPVSNRTEDIEQAILKYTNIERENAGLKPLIWDDKLGEIARAHSLDMVNKNYFEHWQSSWMGENIGKMPTGNVEGMGYVSSDADSIGKAHVESWMGSSGHRANILDTQYDYIGVGVAFDGEYYVATQNFR